MNNLGVFHFLFYALVTSVYVYAFCIYDARLFRENKYAPMGFPFDASYGGRAKFLTYNNVALQIIFFSLSTINAFASLFSSDSLQSNTGLRKFTNFIYTSFAFPLGSIVTILFWSIYMVDRSLVFPKELDAIVPVWLNHILHTLPLASLLVEAYFTQHVYPSFFKGATWTAVCIVSYIAWTLLIAFETDKWIYPILRLLTPLNRGLFIGSQTLFATFLYKMGEYLNSHFWRPKIKFQ